MAIKLNNILGELDAGFKDILIGLSSWIGADNILRKVYKDDEAKQNAQMYLSMLNRELAKLEQEDYQKYQDVIARVQKLANTRAFNRGQKIKAAKEIKEKAKAAMAENDEKQRMLETVAGSVADDINSTHASSRTKYLTKKQRNAPDWRISDSEKAERRFITNQLAYGINTEKGIH